MQRIERLDKVARQYKELSEQINELEAEKRELGTQLKDAMGLETMALPHFNVTKYLIERKSYPVMVVRDLLGRDADNFLKVDRTKLDNFVAMRVAESDMARPKWPRIMAKLAQAQVTDSVSTGLKVTSND